MLGCIGLKCNEVEVIENGEQPTSTTATKAATADQIEEDDDNDLVLKPLSVEIPAGEQPQKQGRCPFKQCVETFSPRQLMKDDAPVSSSSSNSVSAVLEEQRQEETPPVDNTATAEKTASPINITGITTIDAIRSKAKPTPRPPKQPPVITGITTIDAIIHTLSGDNIQHHKMDNKNNNDLERKEEILKQLGILHLQDKLTRPRQSQETEEHILREAGAALHLDDHDDDDESISKRKHKVDTAVAIVSNKKEDERKKMASLSKRELEILKEAGVTHLQQLDHPSNHNPHPDTVRECLTETTVGLTTVGGVTTVQHSGSFLSSPNNNNNSVAFPSSYLEEESQTTMNNTNHTYAEKELLRRLKNGWASIGSYCQECGMPIIYKIDEQGGDVDDGGIMMECVICGILENEQDNVGVQESLSNFDTTISSGMTINHSYYGQDNGGGKRMEQQASLSNFGSMVSSYAPFIGGGLKNTPSGMEIYNSQHQREMATSPTGMSIHHHSYPRATAISPSSKMSFTNNHEQTLEQCPSCQDEVTSQDSTIFGQNHQPHCQSCEKDMMDKCKSDLALQDDDALKKELGRRIFAGWTLLSLTCPNCNLPLICEGKGSSSICLRCD